MLRNYIKVMLRTLRRHKGYSFINIAGLAVGLACCILIMLYLDYEFSYDRFHEHAPNIYRVLSSISAEFLEADEVTMTPPPLAGMMKETFPEVLTAGRLGVSNPALIKYGDKIFVEKRMFYAEPEILDIFSFSFLAGDPSTALTEPYSVVITRRMAEKIFGDEDPLGKSFQIGTVFDLTVTGIIDDLPDNSHLHPDYLVSLSTRKAYWGERSVGAGGGMMSFGGVSALSGDDFAWHVLSGLTYLRLAEGADAGALEDKLRQWSWQNLPEDGVRDFRLQAMTDIHLYGGAAREIEENSDIRYIYFVAGIALLILIIACFNYMNLATARAATRAREIGLRKVSGAGRGRLVVQFLGESLLTTCAAVAVALLLAELFLPVFNSLVGRELQLDLLADARLIAALGVLVFTVGMVAGAYPALVLSSFRPLAVIRQNLTGGSRGAAFFKNILVVLQYVIAITLIVCTAFVYRQLAFIRSANLGYKTENVIAIGVAATGLNKRFNALKNDLQQHPAVTGMAGSEVLPTSEGGGAAQVWWEGKGDEESPFFHWAHVDYDFLDFYGMKLSAGRNFSRDFPGDLENAYILNESAVKALGWTDALGKKFGLSAKDVGTVVGVVKDYHYASLHEKIEPMALMLTPGKSMWLSIRTAPGEQSTVLDYLQSRWKEYSIAPLEFRIVDDLLDRKYKTERTLWKIFSYSTVLSVFVACLGLFGLAAYATAQRTREIGIRKVFGSGVTRLALRMTRQFIGLVVIANLIAWPIAWLAVRRWLEGFAYRIDIGITTFIVAGAAALLIAACAVSGQSIKAAVADPVEILRHE